MAFTMRFWHTVHETWPAHTTLARHVTRTVLRNLRRRLPAEEAGTLFEHLPRPLADLGDDPGIHPREPVLESLGASGFLAVVAHENGLAPEDAERATMAVFRGLKALLPDPAVGAIGKRLQPGLDTLWLKA